MKKLAILSVIAFALSVGGAFADEAPTKVNNPASNNKSLVPQSETPVVVAKGKKKPKKAKAAHKKHKKAKAAEAAPNP